MESIRNKRLLVIDYMSPIGHLKFDSIHVEALHACASSLTVVGRTSLVNDLPQYDNVCVRFIPEWMYKVPFKRCRLDEFLMMAYLKLKLLFWGAGIDAIVFMSYDIISLSLFRSKKPVFLINHNNVYQLNNSVKLLLTKHLPYNFIHIALSHDMENRLKELLPGKCVYYIPHGIYRSQTPSKRPQFISENEKFFFCPVNRNQNDRFSNLILGAPPVQTFLEEHHVNVYTKQLPLHFNSSKRIVKIEGYLSMEEYVYMLQHALAIILPYGEDFKYRVSGIMFECIGYNVPIIATKIPALMTFAKGNAPIYGVDDVNGFIEAVLAILGDRKIKSWDLDGINPVLYWGKVLSI